MVRSYDVSVHFDEGYLGFRLHCYEGEEVIYEQFFRSSDEAHIVGNMFLDGKYVKGYFLEDVI